ncbi:MAG: Concanavalin A-like lectin/glucanase superfamily [Myxococcaceae bacterium]|nr:Concanavalin A-like lectin/glucanase superfamily [Myxococcaceae bacterium]
MGARYDRGMRRWGRRVGIVTAALLPLVALACNALNGAGDLSVAACDTCDEIDGQDDRGNEGGVMVGEAGVDAPGPDASADVVVVPRPSFCNGIVMYARFDNTLTTAEGIAPDMPPATAFVAGRFGSAALLTGTSGALYYVEGDAGVPYPKDEGTIAMWVKPQWTWPPSVTRIFWKPVSDRTTSSTNESGPYLLVQNPQGGSFGAYCSPPNGATVTTGGTATEATPYWSSQWNHLAETWSRSAPTLSFTLNGASGDASVTRRETAAGWTAEQPTVAYVRLSSNSFPSDSAYDDVVMWSRSLSLAEIQAVYGAGVALGDVCGL